MMGIDYIKMVLAGIIEKAKDTDNPLLDDLIYLYDEIDRDGGTYLNEQ